MALFLAVSLIITRPANATVTSEIAGTVRVQILSPTLVRLENIGPEGFEDRTTFHIVNRNWPGAAYTRSVSGSNVLLQTADFIVQVPTNAASLNGIIITRLDGTRLWSYSALPANDQAWLPGIAESPLAWAIADTPRVAPASWGYDPAPLGATNYNSNGWDLNNDAPDFYVFLPQGNARQVRADFISLTGRPPLIPLYGFGFWDSRYYEYTTQTALQQIDNYRSNDIPLDVLAIDTCWRVGCSTGYTINSNDFPDLTGFMNSAHASNVRVMFNDHPQQIDSALAPDEVTYRNNGLHSILGNGLDIWWFDRNWNPTLTPPTNIDLQVWGMYIYNWVTADYYTGRRPMIMANADGINTGSLDDPPSIAAHRYPIQWTGDINPDFGSLQTAVQDAVVEGANAAFPYLAVDLGGFTSNPDTEGYVRWLEYGSLSPICRVHCTLGLTRMPWTFGIPAETVARNFIKMRYRLLPLFYSQARKAYDTGEPILRRCDFDYPSYQQAAANTQYLLGNSTLVAPVLSALPYTVVPSTWLQTTSGVSGLVGQYYSNTNLTGSPALTRTDSNVNFNWNSGSPGSGVPSTDFSAQWTGSITIGTQDVVLAVTSDDGARLYIDGNLVFDAWVPQNSILNETTVTFAKNTTHTINLQYVQFAGNDVCELQWRPVTVSQSLWIPPGNWIDAWSGNVINGPQTISANVPLPQIPIYIKPGTLVPLAPEMSYAGQQPWDPITLDVYPSMESNAVASLYEDDTVTPNYITGAYRTTQITASANDAGQSVTVTINPAQGTFTGASTNRSWIVRIHKPVEWSYPTPASATLDGVSAAVTVIAQDTNAMPFAVSGGSPDGDVATVTVPSGPVTNTHTVVVNYSVALTATCPGNIVVNTDPGSCSATVNYTVTAADNNTGLTTTCTTNGQPVSLTGAIFPIGTTAVLCGAGDASNNTASCAFTVTVNCPPPSISLQPVNQTVCAGGTAAFSISATGNGPASYAWRQRGSGWGAGGWQLNGAGTKGGFYMGSSTGNGQGDPGADGDIDTVCGPGCHRSWAIWSSNNNVMEAIRPFNGTLAVGQTFQIAMDNGYELSSQSCGFGLRAGGITNRFEFYFIGGSNDYYIHDGRGLNQDTGIPFSDQGLQIAFTLTGPDSYSLTVNPVGADNTFNPTTITGTLTGTAGSGIDRVRLFDYNPGASSPTLDLFFNSISFANNDDNAADPAYSGGWTNGSDGGQSPLANGGNISGANTATLVVSNAQPANAGSYDVSVSAACNPSVLSAAASLVLLSPTVCSTLAITSPPDQSYVTSAAIAVSGTATAPTGVLGVTVNGTAATSVNGFTNWTAAISGLATCTNTLMAVATDTLGNTVTNFSHVIVALGSVDCNGDGLPDAWQLRYFGCVSCPQAAPGADPDNDGFTNLEEYQAGTDPTNALSSPFRITSITRQSNDVLLTWTTAGGTTNLVQASGSISTNFATISPPIVIPGASLTSTNYLDAGGATNSPPRFYRIQLLP